MPNVKGTRPTTSATTTGNESHRKRHRSFSSSFVGSGLGWFRDWVFFLGDKDLVIFYLGLKGGFGYGHL